MQRVVVRTDQLLHIAEATGSKFHQQDSEAKTDGRVKKLVQLLKQYHAWFYHFYEKASTRAMIGLHRLHSNDLFQHMNVAGDVALKLFCPWCCELGGKTETIATHLWEV